MIPNISVAILAGGQSRRMGTDKSLLKLNEKPLLAHVVERLTPLALPIMLVTNTPQHHAAFGLPMVSDVYPQRGSLGGLYTALHYSPAEYTLCVACDMPFLNVDLLRYLLTLCGDADAVVPHINGAYESLHAVYRRTSATLMQQQIEQQQLRIQHLYAHLRIRAVTADEVARFDPDYHSFTNLNTPDEAALAQNQRL